MARSDVWALACVHCNYFFFTMIFGAEVYATNHKTVYTDTLHLYLILSYMQSIKQLTNDPLSVGCMSCL
jgi:hypothetical protein